MRLSSIAMLVAAGLVATAATRPPATHAAHAQLAAAKGDPVRGARLYQACMGCHSLDENDVGPLHRGVVGRSAGAVPGYAYSSALRKSGIVWTPANLDRWLRGPQAMVPGSKMFFSIPAAQDRADIVAFLAKSK